ncbi:type II secretion system F family protein [Patescibacteria group bacterium]|nr:type II secretion system F family protein [Patescibacteria group bacterium]
MEEYSYTAVSKGSSDKGTIQATDKEEALKKLHDLGYTVTELKSSASKDKNNLNKAKVKIVEKLLFFDHLEKMINAGLSLSDTLDALVDDAQTKNFKKIIMDLKFEIESGDKLSRGMSKYPKIFSSIETKMIDIGEVSGSLAENAKLIKDQVQKTYDLRKKVKSAMMYPIIIASVMLIVGTGLIIFVYPQLATMFKNSGEKLPLPTVIMITISNIVTHYWFFTILFIVALVIVIRILLRNPKFKYMWNKISIHIPIFGELIKKINVTNFSRTLGNLIKSGIKINDAVNITKDTIPNEAYKKVIAELENNVERGDPVEETLKKYPKLFPPISVRMIAIGDKTGNTADMLLSVAEFYQTQIDDTLDNLSTIIEPIMLFVMGGGVLLIALSVIAPIYQMTGSINANTGSSSSSSSSTNGQ